MSQAQRDALKPCPFCGVVPIAISHDTWKTDHTETCALKKGGGYWWFVTAKDAKTWNLRYPDETPAPAGPQDTLTRCVICGEPNGSSHKADCPKAPPEKPAQEPVTWGGVELSDEDQRALAGLPPSPAVNRVADIISDIQASEKRIASNLVLLELCRGMANRHTSVEECRALLVMLESALLKGGTNG